MRPLSSRHKGVQFPYHAAAVESQMGSIKKKLDHWWSWFHKGRLWDPQSFRRAAKMTGCLEVQWFVHCFADMSEVWGLTSGGWEIEGLKPKYKGEAETRNSGTIKTRQPQEKVSFTNRNAIRSGCFKLFPSATTIPGKQRHSENTFIRCQGHRTENKKT